MIRIQIVYDKYNRMFRLLDKDIASVLEDGEVYEVEVPIELEGCQEGGDDDIAISCVPLAHA
jgi:hypothetical protein